MTRVDHLLVAVAELPPSRARWAAAGLAATTGGRHPAGTSNALIRGPRPAYLELITADPEATSDNARRVLGSPGPLSWAVGVEDIEAARGEALASGAEPGPILDGSRENPDGEVLRWRVCDLMPTPLHPAVPFLIEWQPPMPPGPPDGPVLTEVTVGCADPQAIGRILSACGLTPLDGGTEDEIALTDGEVRVRLCTGEPGLMSAELRVSQGPLGDVELDGLMVRRVPVTGDDR